MCKRLQAELTCRTRNGSSALGGLIAEYDQSVIDTLRANLIGGSDMQLAEELGLTNPD